MPENTIKEDNPKVRLIIDCTLEVLRDHGEQGLSVRKVAAKAGMSLGNLQFYFKNKDELLRGVVDVYFARCYTDFNDRLLECAPEGKREVIQFLVNYGMGYAHSEIGEVFRELWGMAAGNQGIREQLHEYYRVYIDELTNMLTPFARKSGSIPKALTLLIPYFDGHSLISCPLPLNEKETTEFLINVVDSVFEGEL